MFNKKLPVLLIITSIILSGCAAGEKVIKKEIKREPEPQPPAAVVERAPQPETTPWVKPVFKAVLKPNTVSGDLSNVVNLHSFGRFTPDQKALLAQNGFVVTPGKSKQIFYVYEHNGYYNLPSFITTDSILHTYHVFYDFTLRRMEKEFFSPLLKELTGRMLDLSMMQYRQSKNSEVKESARLNAAYFSVAAKLLDELAQTPPEVSGEVGRELELISKHSGRSPSAIFPYMIDYSQFQPRGHYTRDEEFKKYFMAMMWYGLAPFPLEYASGGGMVRADRQIVQAQLFTAALFQPGEGLQKAAVDSWEKIYDATTLYIGRSDDFTPRRCMELMAGIYGDLRNIDSFAESQNLNAFYERAKKLPGPDIRQQLAGVPTGPQFRFMGQRYIPDSEILQELSHYPERPFPRGLDVMAALGSGRAREILLNSYREAEKWPIYTAKLDEMNKKFNSLGPYTGQFNMYYGWLWCLQPLLEEKGQGYPSFMTGRAWQDKSLNTSLGSWAQLRHDTILYGKGSSAECGGDPEPPVPPGYVEPEVEFYARLGWLTRHSREQLAGRRLLTPSLTESFERLESLIGFLRDVSVKELAGEPLTGEENNKIRFYGHSLESMMLSTMEGDPVKWFAITSETDKNMACIADVHTSLGTCLEEGVGLANEIFVVVPVQGKLYLTRGAVFSYYEFTHPASQRLTDEAWQEMLNKSRAPAPPEWTRSFVSGPKEAVPRPEQVFPDGMRTGAEYYNR